MFKLAAPGAGAMVFQELDSNTFRVLLAMRTALVGLGLGITGGGFIECGAIDALQVDTIIQTADEAYRELCQENLGFENVVDIDTFLLHAQPIALVHARTNDVNRVHSVNMYGFRANDSQWNRIAALEPGLDKERTGPLLEHIVRWKGKIDRREPERFVTIEDARGRFLERHDFHHKHEMHTVASIAWHAQNGRLLP